MEYDDMYASVLTTEGMIGILLDTFFFHALIDRKLHIYIGVDFVIGCGAIALN